MDVVTICEFCYIVYISGWVEACGGKCEATMLNPEDAFKFHIERLVANGRNIEGYETGLKRLARRGKAEGLEF